MCTALWEHPSHGPTRCGQCMECRLSYSREWAIRMTHEMQMHKQSCMLNLTYDDDHLPEHGQLVKQDLQKFFKRLRINSGPFRYVASGEYGDISRRPHFHIALFGMDFHQDRTRIGTAKGGDHTYISADVARSWKLGQHVIGTLNFESCAYISRYILKKIKGLAKPDPLYVDPDTGEVVMPNSEFMRMSKGIGKAWFRDFFMSDVYPHASVITQQGTRAPVPRYYKSLLKEVGTDLAFDMSARTVSRMYADIQWHELAPCRKSARAAVSAARAKVSKRDI